jgi:hypothetical protein
LLNCKKGGLYFLSTALLEELDRHAAEHRRKLQEMDLPLR